MPPRKGPAIKQLQLCQIWHPCCGCTQDPWKQRTPRSLIGNGQDVQNMDPDVVLPACKGSSCGSRRQVATLAPCTWRPCPSSCLAIQVDIESQGSACLSVQEQQGRCRLSSTRATWKVAMLISTASLSALTMPCSSQTPGATASGSGRSKVSFKCCPALALHGP